MSQPDPEMQLAKEAREAILDLRTTLQSLKKEEQISWRKKSQLMRDRRFETNTKRKRWATSDLSEALGDEALALGATLAEQRDGMQTIGDDLRKEVRVHRKPPLPNFPREPRYTPELKQTERTQRVSTPGRGEHGSAQVSGEFRGSFTDRPIPPPMHVELDPRTAAILARVEQRVSLHCLFPSSFVRQSKSKCKCKCQCKNQTATSIPTRITVRTAPRC